MLLFDDDVGLIVFGVVGFKFDGLLFVLYIEVFVFGGIVLLMVDFVIMKVVDVVKGGMCGDIVRISVDGWVFLS